MSQSQPSSEGIIEMFSKEGVPFKYQTVSGRISGFLEKYPADEYSVVITAADSMSVKPALLEMYLQCIKSGKNFTDFGLPSYEGQQQLVFTAKLIGKDDRIVRQVSAVFTVTDHKDYESGETAAFQRLLAQLGFGGTVFDDDEGNDFDKQGLNISDQSNTSTPSPQNNVSVLGTSNNDSTNSVSSAQFVENISEVSDNLLDQIEQLAAVKKMDYTIPTTMPEAKRLLKTLQSS